MKSPLAKYRSPRPSGARTSNNVTKAWVTARHRRRAARRQNVVYYVLRGLAELRGGSPGRREGTPATSSAFASMDTTSFNKSQVSTKTGASTAHRACTVRHVEEVRHHVVSSTSSPARFICARGFQSKGDLVPTPFHGHPCRIQRRRHSS